MTFGIRRSGGLWAFCLSLVCALAPGQTARAQSPITAPVRTDSAAIGSTFSPTLLRDLPSSNNLFQLLETAEGEVISDRFYGGGLNTGRPARDGAFLTSWQQTQFFVGDVNVTVPNGGAPYFFPVLTPWDHVDVSTALMPFGMNAPGLAVGFSPVRPATKWTTSVEASGAPSQFVAKPSTSVAPPIETLKQWTHGSALVSGPLSPRVGLMAVVDWSGNRQVERTGAAQADGQSASAFANLVITPDANTEIRTVGWVQRTQAPFAGALAFHEPMAADQTLFAHVQSTWEHRRGNELDLRVFGAYSQSDGSRANASPLSPVIERLLDGPVPSLIDSGDRTDRQWSAGARAAMARRQHTVFAGMDVTQARSRIGPAYVGTVAEAIDGAPARIWSYSGNAIGDDHRRITTLAAFVSDSIALGTGRTFDVGIDYDLSDGSAEGAVNGITWQNVLPRALLRWKQSESSHVTWIAGYRRSPDRLTTDTLAVGDPAAPHANVLSWTPAGPGTLLYTVGPGTGTGASANLASIDQSIRRPVTDEVVAGIDVQLTPNIRGRITGVAKRAQHLIDLVNVGTPASGYTTFTVIDGRPAADGGDVPLTVYSRLLTTTDRYVLTNMAGDDSASGAGLVLNSEAVVKRLTLMFNASASITDGPAANRGFHADENDLGIGETASDLNASLYARGRLFYDRAFTMKLSAVYRFPHDVTFGAIARYQDGQPFSRMTIVPGATTTQQATQGIEYIRAYPAGDARFKYTGTLDVRLQKQIAVSSATIDVFVDGYNVINMGNEVEERIVTGPGFRDITAIQPPAAVLVGVRMHF